MLGAIYCTPYGDVSRATGRYNLYRTAVCVIEAAVLSHAMYRACSAGETCTAFAKKKKGREEKKKGKQMLRLEEKQRFYKETVCTLIQLTYAG